MELNLRKAYALSHQILVLASQQMPRKSIALSIYDARLVSSVRTRVKEISDKTNTDLTNALALQDVAYKIRGAIAHVNATVGVDRLLAEQKGLETQIGALTAFVEHDIDEDVATLEAKIAAMREQATLPGTERSYIGGGGDYLTIIALSNEARAALKARLSKMQKRKTAISDEILAINLTQKITLDKATADLLARFDLP